MTRLLLLLPVGLGCSLPPGLEDEMKSLVAGSAGQVERRREWQEVAQWGEMEGEW
jgi:hypothetical protein